MARRLTEPMKEALHIMAEGSEVEVWKGLTERKYWDYMPPPFPFLRPLASTVEALERRELVKALSRRTTGSGIWHSRVIARYALTKAGRRVEEELA